MSANSGILKTFVNKLDPFEAPQYVGPHLRSKLFDTQFKDKKWLWVFAQIINQQNILTEFLKSGEGDTRAPDKVRIFISNVYFLTKSYVLPLVRIVSSRRF